MSTLHEKIAFQFYLIASSPIKLTKQGVMIFTTVLLLTSLGISFSKIMENNIFYTKYKFMIIAIICPHYYHLYASFGC